MKRREENVRRCRSAVMNEIREHEVERKCEIKTVSRPQGEVRTMTRVCWSSFRHEFLSRCRVNSSLVTILTSFPFSDFFMNLADRDISDTNVVMTARTSGADKGNHRRNALI